MRHARLVGLIQVLYRKMDFNECIGLYAPFEGSLTRREPRSNPKQRSLQSICGLQILPGRQIGLNSPLVCPAKHPVLVRTSDLRCCQSPSMLDALAAPWRARASGVLLHGTGTGTADELACVTNQRPSIFLASPSRLTWLLAVQNGWPVAGFNDTSK